MSNYNKILNKNKILWVIFITVFIDMMGIGVLIPVFPLLVLPASIYKITPNTWNTADGFIMIGWLMASFPLAQFIFTPILGQLSDNYGRRKILALSISGTLISYLLFAYSLISKNIPLMFFSRILDGISGGNISIAQAVIGDVSEAKARAKNFGLIGVALGLGFIFGPFIGGKLSDYSLVSWFNVATPFWFAAILSFINLILVLIFLPETLTTRGTNQIMLVKSIQNIGKAFSYKELRQIIPVSFLFNAGFTFYTTFWGIILANKFGFNQGGIGDFFAYMGVMVVLAQAMVVRRISAKIADYKVLRYSIIGCGICILANYYVPANKIAWLYYIPPLLAICVASTKAFTAALLTRTTPASMRGEVMGINASATALAQALPAIVAGYIASYHAILPILYGSIITIIGGVIFIYTFKEV